LAHLTIESRRLSGTVLAQPSKSMAHRALICAFLSKGESSIDNIVFSRDIETTLGAVSALGAAARIMPSKCFPGRHRVIITSSGEVKPGGKVINCHESGSTARFIMPITRLSSEPVTLTGSGRLVSRPFDIYRELFTQKGVSYRDDGGRMPISLEGRLQPGEYTLSGDVSSQFISGLLFTLPLLDGDSTLRVVGPVESLPYIQMTLVVMKDFGVGAEVSEDYRTYAIKGNQRYAARNMTVEGDWSQAAFFCVLGAISGGVRIDGLNFRSLQGDKVILDLIRRMGSSARAEGDSLIIEKGSLQAISVDVSQCPDLVPALAVALSLCEGRSEITNAARLRIKESDRLKAVCEEMNRLGARIEELPDGLVIHGVSSFHGNTVQGWNDHRIVMAIAVASSVCNGNILLDGSEAVFKSYPGFWDDFKALGGMIK